VRRPADAVPEAGAAAPPSGERALSEEESALLDRLAQATARFGMTVPAVFLLESSKPLSFVGSQFLHFLSPIVSAVLEAREVDRLAALLERRGTIEELIVRIERAEEVRRPRK
jgi:hypothetical protein